jgi:integrase
MADRVLALIRRVLNWHQSRSDNFVSPVVKGMARTKPKERARDRILSPAEIRAVWEASKTVKPPAFGNLVRGLFLTAARRDELAAGQWAELREDEEHGKVFEIAGERVKNKKPHVIPLTDAAVAEFPKKHEGEGRPFVYGRAGMRAFSGFSKAKRKLDAETLKWLQAEAEKRGDKPKKVEPLPHWTLHDIRRTCRSILSGEGVSNDVAERCLGHVMQGVRGVYDRYDYLAEKRAALEKLGTRLAIIVSDDAKKVLTLKRA